MAELYQQNVSKAPVELELAERLFLEICDYDTKALLHLSDISLYPCGRSGVPTLTAMCKSREVAEAIGERRTYIKTKLKQVAGCDMSMAVYYHIPEGQVYFDTEGKVAPARWYLYNRREIGKDRIIPLPG